jgi:hypothetical protein
MDFPDLRIDSTIDQIEKNKKSNIQEKKVTQSQKKISKYDEENTRPNSASSNEKEK